MRQCCFRRRRPGPGSPQALPSDHARCQATDTPWNSHSSCYLAVAPSPIPFIRALTDQGKVYFRMFDHHDVPHDALFNLGKVSEVRSRLAEACNWDGASKVTGSPAPKAE